MNATSCQEPISLDLRNAAYSLIWIADRENILVRVCSEGDEVALDLGPEAIAQLRRALA